MKRDPKQTQTLEEPREQDVALRTTVVQPIPLSRHPEFVRTRYWEKLADEPEAPKRSAASYASPGKTVVGLGPDDPIVRAVEAAKQHLLEAQRAHKSGPSYAKTVVLSRDVVQRMAARLKAIAAPDSEADEAVTLPKRKLAPVLVGAGVSAAVLCAGIALMPTSSTEEPARPARAVESRSETSAAPTPASAQVEPGAGVAADSVDAPAEAAQVSEKAAVDALYAGDYALARERYAALASAHPEQPAFAEAVRILKRNAK